MPTKTPSLLRRTLDRGLAEAGLDNVEAFVTSLRHEGESWETCARAVSQHAGEPVSHVSLRNWFPNLREVAA